MFAPLGFAGDVGPERLALLADPSTAALAGMDTIDDAVDSGAWLVGPPERIIEAFEELQDSYPGLEEIMVAQPVGARPSLVADQLRLFATEVMPSIVEKPTLVGGA